MPDDDRFKEWSRTMSGFEVQIDQLRTAAEAAGSAADQARAVDPGAGLDAIAAALPGGVAASSAPTLASTFNQRARTWADDIDRWGRSVTAVAQTYADSDDAARRAFG
ncbi:hypothetical protein AB0J80_38280 [Actinoplanes sp. NPDC049548]|uniref:hypothetical protein n=1 Tax=Actinoplanes sp. NPDC049548 TaxID=3155152 RepID=UPI0034233104